MPENEMLKPRATRAPARSRSPVKQWMTPPTRVAPSSSRTSSVSPAASRVWMTTGSRARRARSAAEDLALHVARRVVVVEVEADLAERDAPTTRRARRHHALDRSVERHLAGVMRMDAGREPDAPATPPAPWRPASSSTRAVASRMQMAWCTPAACARDDDLRRGRRRTRRRRCGSGCRSAFRRPSAVGAFADASTSAGRDASERRHLTRVPGVGGVSKLMSCALPSVSAARTIPCDTRPIIGRGCEVGDERDRPADDRVGRIGLRNAGQDRALGLGPVLHRQLQQFLRLRDRLGGHYLADAQLDLHEVVDGDDVVVTRWCGGRWHRRPAPRWRRARARYCRPVARRTARGRRANLLRTLSLLLTVPPLSVADAPLQLVSPGGSATMAIVPRPQRLTTGHGARIVVVPCAVGGEAALTKSRRGSPRARAGSPASMPASRAPGPRRTVARRRLSAAVEQHFVQGRVVGRILGQGPRRAFGQVLVGGVEQSVDRGRRPDGGHSSPSRRRTRAPWSPRGSCSRDGDPVGVSRPCR